MSRWSDARFSATHGDKLVFEQLWVRFGSELAEEGLLEPVELAFVSQDPFGVSVEAAVRVGFV